MKYKSTLKYTVKQPIVILEPYGHCLTRLNNWCQFWITSTFEWLTSLRWNLSAGVQFSSTPQRPKSCHCLSGCPGKSYSQMWIRCVLLPIQRAPKIWTACWHFITTETGTKSLLEELSAVAPPGATLQTSSLWADTFWMASQRHSRQRAHSYNTWSRNDWHMNERWRVVQTYKCSFPNMKPYISNYWYCLSNEE